MKPIVQIRELFGRKFLYVEGEERGVQKRWWFDLDSLRMMFWHQRPSGERRISIIGTWSTAENGLVDEYSFDGPLCDAVIDFLETQGQP